MAKFLDKTGLDTFWAKIKSTFQTLGNLVTKSTGWSGTPSDTKYPSEMLVKTSLDGKADDSNVVHKTGDEDIAGNKRFTTSFQTVYGSSGGGYGMKVLKDLSFGTAYNNWDESLKDGEHFREWRIYIPSGTNFDGRLRLTITAAWYNNNSGGSLSKTFSMYVNGSSCHCNDCYYDSVGGAIANEFRISDLVWNGTDSRWEIIIHSITPSSDNSIYSPVVEWVSWTKAGADSMRQIDIVSTSPSIVTDTSYTNTKKSKTVSWSTRPRLQTVYGDVFDPSTTVPVANGGTGNTSVDTTPTANSTKMVTSGGIKTALDGKSNTGHTHSNIVTEGDNRNVSTTPNDYSNKFAFRGLKTKSAIGNPSDSTYAYLLGLRGWTDNSGGKSHELAFNNDGIFTRKGGTTSWEEWEKLATSKDLDAKAPNAPSEVTIANGDKIVITDASDSNKVKRASVAFDGSTENSVLTKKGTFKAVSDIISGDFRTKNQDISKGANLVVNGSGRMASSYNFSAFSYIPTIANGGSAGSFGFSGSVVEDEYISCDFNKKIVISADIKNLVAQPSNCTHRLAVYEYDIDKNAINAPSRAFGAGTLTQLTQDLNPGDTVVHLADLSNANWLSAYTHHRGFIFWNYKNSYDYLYPPETYSRNYYPSSDSSVLWDVANVNVSAGTITLNNAWAGPLIPAGTKVSRRSSGGWPYPASSNFSDTEWHSLKGSMKGIVSGLSSTQFSLATAFIKVGLVPTNLSNTDSVTSKRAVVTNFFVYEEQDINDGFGTLPVNRGGTGKTTAKAAVNALLGGLPTESSDMVDNTPIVMKYYSPTDSNGALYTRTGLQVWSYIKAQISSVLGLTSSSYGGNAATATTATDYNTSSGTIKTALDGKVDKVTGKSLSTNDYTTTEKNKLAGIAEGAEVNVQSDWNQTTTTADDYIKNKPTIPSGTQLVYDCGTGSTSTTDFSNALAAYTAGKWVIIKKDGVIYHCVGTYNSGLRFKAFANESGLLKVRTLNWTSGSAPTAGTQLEASLSGHTHSQYLTSSDITGKMNTDGSNAAAQVNIIKDGDDVYVRVGEDSTKGIALSYDDSGSTPVMGIWTRWASGSGNGKYMCKCDTSGNCTFNGTSESARDAYHDYYVGGTGGGTAYWIKIGRVTSPASSGSDGGALTAIISSGFNTAGSDLSAQIIRLSIRSKGQSTNGVTIVGDNVTLGLKSAVDGGDARFAVHTVTDRTTSVDGIYDIYVEKKAWQHVDVLQLHNDNVAMTYNSNTTKAISDTTNMTIFSPTMPYAGSASTAAKVVWSAGEASTERPVGFANSGNSSAYSQGSNFNSEIVYDKDFMYKPSGSGNGASSLTVTNPKSSSGNESAFIAKADVAGSAIWLDSTATGGSHKRGLWAPASSVSGDSGKWILFNDYVNKSNNSGGWEFIGTSESAKELRIPYGSGSIYLQIGVSGNYLALGTNKADGVMVNYASNASTAAVGNMLAVANAAGTGVTQYYMRAIEYTSGGTTYIALTKNDGTSNVRVRSAENADGCDGWKFKVGSLGTATDTIYFIAGS